MSATRPILSPEQTHPAIRDFIAHNHADIVEEVKTTLDANRVVIVGMAQNPFPKKARRLLSKQGIAHQYLEYGSYLSQWRRRNALKMWTGWPTFPMVFVDGMLIGGCQELQKMMASGELTQKLSSPRI